MSGLPYYICLILCLAKRCKEWWVRLLTNKTRYGLISLLLVNGCSLVTSDQHASQALSSDQSGNNFLIVDCLLPGQVRKLGGQFSYITARRPIKTSASNCEIRGGEYVSFDRADYATALKIWLPLAQEGDAEAQAYVGEIYEKGLGVIPDFEVAAHWYQMAANQKLARAQINLGHLYEKGLGVEKNIVTALSYYRMASGLTSDQLTYTSSLQASYVPREQFQAVSQQLTRSQDEQAKIAQQIEHYETNLEAKSRYLAQSKATLKQTQEQLQALLSNPPANATGLSNEREQQLLAEIQSLSQHQDSLQHQITDIQNNARLLGQQKRQLEAQIEEQKTSEATLKAQLSQTQAELDRNASALYRSQLEIDTLNQSLSASKIAGRATTQERQAEIQALENSLRAKNSAIAQQQEQYEALQHQYLLRQHQLAQVTAQLGDQEGVLSSQLAEFKTQQLSYQQSIAEKERELTTVITQLQDNEQALHHALAQKQQEIETLTSEHQSDISEYDTQMAVLSKQLGDQQQLVNNQKQQIFNLQSDMDNYNLELIQISALPPTAAGPIDDTPSIEIIDPPVTLTRSTPTVRLRTQQKYRDIIGKVSAPAGLLSLTINGESTTLEDHSLFKTAVPITKEVTPVDVVAVDTKGRRVAISFSMLSESAQRPQIEQPSQKPARLTIDRPTLGNYYALIIGNNDYQTMSTLATAVNDATETERILKNQYHFNTQLLINATRYQILSALNKLREELKEDDNLLIYYAGHGKLDAINKRGFWLPIDADENNSANWISNTAITDILNAMKAKHVLVVADSCYSGTLSQTAISRVEEELEADVKKEWIKVMANTRARIMLTSGGVEPVLDGGGGKHSIFAKAFLDTLRDNDAILEGYSLYYEVLTKVMKKASQLDSEQVPQYAPIHLAGHESGEFFFSPKI